MTRVCGVAWRSDDMPADDYHECSLEHGHDGEHECEWCGT